MPSLRARWYRSLPCRLLLALLAPHSAVGPGHQRAELLVASLIPAAPSWPDVKVTLVNEATSVSRDSNDQ